MSVSLMKFDGDQCRTDCVGYTGSNDRVAAALNQMFAPEIAVAELTLPNNLGPAQNVQTFKSQVVGSVQTGGIGGRQ